MNHRSLLLLAVGTLFLCLAATAQNSVGIGTETPNSNAVLHLVSPDGDQGFLVPQLTTVQRTATTFTDNLAASDAGLLVFDTDETVFFYWSGSDWSTISPQQLTAGTGITITNGVIANSGDLDATNEIQDLSLSGNSLTITNNGAATTIDLTPYLDNTDDQTATEVPVTASGNLTSTNVQDALSELQGDVDNINLTGGDNQTLSLSGSTLSISGGNSADLSSLIDDADADATNEIQDLSLGRNLLLISGSESSVDLSGYLDNTDDQTLSLSGTDLTISGSESTVDLSVLADGTGTDSQSLTFTGTSLSISGGNTVNLSSLQDGTGTDNQTLSLATNTLTISGSGSNVDLSGYLDNTDAQDLTLTGNTLALTGDGTSVDLSGYLDNTDAQDLSLSGNTLSLTGDGTSVSLAAYLDNTDNQTATEVPVTPGNGMTSSNAQAALAEHQTDINSHTSSISSLNSRVSTLEGGSSEIMILSPTDFAPVEEGGPIHQIRLINGGQIGVFYTTNVEASGSDGTVAAMLKLPNGAKLNKITIYVDEGSKSGKTVTATLYQGSLGILGGTTEGSGATKSPGTIEPVTIDLEGGLGIDNSSRFYMLTIEGSLTNDTEAAEYTRLMAVSLEYDN